MNKRFKVEVTVEGAIILKGSIVKVRDTGNDFFLVERVNGKSVGAFTLWLRSSEFKILKELK